MRTDILKDVAGEIEQDLLDRFETAEDGDDINLQRVTRKQDLAGINFSKELILSYRSTEPNHPEKDFTEGFQAFSGIFFSTRATNRTRWKICTCDDVRLKRKRKSCHHVFLTCLILC